MKRRGFLGLMGGAAVAGPAMAKEAVTKLAQASTLADLQLPSALGQVAEAGGWARGLVAGGGTPFDHVTRAKKKLDLIRGFTADQRSALKAGQHVASLDPDLASYRSFSLAAKIDMQRGRIVDKLLSERKSWWQRIADGFDPYSGPEEDDNHIW